MFCQRGLVRPEVEGRSRGWFWGWTSGARMVCCGVGVSTRVVTEEADVEPAEALVDEKEDSDEGGEGARSLRKAAVKSRSSRRL